MNLKVSIDPSCIKKLESTYINSNVPKILVGDTVKIGVSIITCLVLLTRV